MGIYVEFTRSASSVVLTNTARSKRFTLHCTLHWYYTGYFSSLVVQFKWHNGILFVTLIRLAVLSLVPLFSQSMQFAILTWPTPTKLGTSQRTAGSILDARKLQMIRKFWEAAGCQRQYILPLLSFLWPCVGHLLQKEYHLICPWKVVIPAACHNLCRV